MIGPVGGLSTSRCARARASPGPNCPHPCVPGPGRGRVLLFHAGPLTALVGDGMLWVVDRESATALRWTEGSEDIPIWEALRPLRFVLRWWAAEHDAALLHAAAVAIDGHAALLVGESGAGKSTTAFACMGSELVVLGDDYCLVEAPKGSGQITVHATYRLGNLTDASLALLPHLRERVIGSGLRGKSVIALEPLSLGQGAASRAFRLRRDPGPRRVDTSDGGLRRGQRPVARSQHPLADPREPQADVGRRDERLPASARLPTACRRPSRCTHGALGTAVGDSR